jgi:Calcium binding
MGLGASGYACPVAAFSKAELAAMAEEATVDCYGEDEQAMGFHTMIVDNLKMPFVTSVLGVDVTVEDIDLADDGSIVAICARGGIRQAIRVVDLPLPAPPPAGAEWIEAYRHWRG